MCNLLLDMFWDACPAVVSCADILAIASVILRVLELVAINKHLINVMQFQVKHQLYLLSTEKKS